MSLHAPWLSLRCLQVEPLGFGGKILERKTDASLVSAGLGLVLVEDASAVHVVSTWCGKIQILHRWEFSTKPQD